MPEEILQVIPILRIFSEEKAKEFYVGLLGCNIDWEHRFGDNAPLYMQVTRGNLVLHLSEHYGDCCPGATVFVRITGIDGLHQELISRNYKYLHPGLEDAPWGAKCMEVADPFGNKIRFSEDIKAANK